MRYANRVRWRCAILLSFYCSAAYAHVGSVVSLARFVNPPPLLTSPDGGVTSAAIQIADGSFDVTWNDGDMDPTGRYFFYYLDRQPPSGASTADVVKLATPIPEGSAGIWTACDCIDGNGVSCPDAGVRDCRDDFVWDTHALAAGSYWIIAVDNDPPYYLYSVAESPLRVAHAGTPPPAALFITPNGIGAADASYKLSWVAAGDAPLQFDLAWGAKRGAASRRSTVGDRRQRHRHRRGKRRAGRICGTPRRCPAPTCSCSSPCTTRRRARR